MDKMLNEIVSVLYSVSSGLWLPKELIKEQVRMDFKYFFEFNHDPTELTQWTYRQ